MNLTQIEANGQIYDRRAWTGGDTPSEMEENFNAEFRHLIHAFYRDQIADASFNGLVSEAHPDYMGKSVRRGRIKNGADCV